MGAALVVLADGITDAAHCTGPGLMESRFSLGPPPSVPAACLSCVGSALHVLPSPLFHRARLDVSSFLC